LQFLLVAINAGVFFLFLVQGYLAWKHPPQAPKSRKVLMDLATEALEGAKPLLRSACESLKLDEEHSGMLLDALGPLANDIPKAHFLMITWHHL
jgi:hypothetical protein